MAAWVRVTSRRSSCTARCSRRRVAGRIWEPAFIIDLGYRQYEIPRCIDWLKGCEKGESDLVWGGESSAASYENGYVWISSDNFADMQVLISSDQFLVLLEKVRESMEHPDYRQPGTNPFQLLNNMLVLFGNW